MSEVFPQIVITKEIASKVLETIDAGLSGGLGTPVPGAMCVEAAVCYALGLDHGDDPKCVGPAIRALKIALNDIQWPNAKDRAKGLRRLGLVQLGSLGTVNEKLMIQNVALWLANKYMRNYLATYPTNSAYAKIRDFAFLFDKKTANVKSLQKKLNIIWDSMTQEWGFCDDFVDGLKDILENVAYDDVGHNDLSHSGEKLSDTLKLIWDDADTKKAELQILNDYAEAVVQILVKMKAPGRKWLVLTK